MSIVSLTGAHPSSAESSLRLAQSKFLASGSADNQLRLWNVSNGKCLYVWEFPTAVKWVAFNDDDERVVCITEQRMGFQGAIRVFRLNRDGDGTDRSFLSSLLVMRRHHWHIPPMFIFLCYRTTRT